MRFIFLSLIAVCAVGAAHASEPQPGFYWNLEFGGAGRSPDLRYGLAVRQADAERRESALPALMTLDFSPAGTGMTLGGLPVWRRQYVVRQAESAEGGEATEGGWLSDLGDAFAGLGVGTGTVLVAGGLAVAVMLLATDADDDRDGNTIDNEGGDGAPNGIVTGGDSEVCVYKGIPPLPDTCTEAP